jgi:hypothetical protein
MYMAGWLTVLKMVPWTEVITHAPKVASGARKLWDSVAHKSPATEAAAPQSGAKEPYTDPTAALTARLDQADAALADLRAQMLSATELITTLAEQNEQLIAKMDAMRTRITWLTVASGAAIALALAAIVIATRA